MPPPTLGEFEQQLIDHIGRHGPITFEAFIEAALYDTQFGYYPSRRRQQGSTPVGTDGDYFTSPVTHPAFGALLALQLREMWQRLGSPGEFVVVRLEGRDGHAQPQREKFIARVAAFPYVEEPASLAAAALESTLVVVDPAWEPLVPGFWRYRMKTVDDQDR